MFLCMCACKTQNARQNQNRPNEINYIKLNNRKGTQSKQTSRVRKLMVDRMICIINVHALNTKLTKCTIQNIYVCMYRYYYYYCNKSRNRKGVAYLLYETLILSFTALPFYIKLIPCKVFPVLGQAKNVFISDN